MGEHEKLEAVKDQSQAIGEFLEWLQYEKHIALCVPHRHRQPDTVKDDPEGCYMGYRTPQCGLRNGEYLHQHQPTESLLAEYFEISLDKIEAEKLTMLDEIRAANAGS